MTGHGRPPTTYPDLYRFDGTVVAVLGGGDGIGRESAHAFAQLGARVAVLDMDASRAERVAEEIGGTAHTVDVRSRAEVTAALERIDAEMGALTTLVDVVGVARQGPLADIDDQAWDEQFDLVLRHAFVAVQVGSKIIARNGGGSIVLVGSTSGVAYTPGQTGYGTAKAALHHLVHCSGRELATHGVRVNAVAPGYTRTPRLQTILSDGQWARIEGTIPRGRAGDPAEVAAPIVFLASAAASYVTGHVLAVDGGLTGMVPSVF